MPPKLHVKNLSQVPFVTLVGCFLDAFQDYTVRMPTDFEYYRQRWRAAGVDFALSYGMFDGDQLVGFIIHAVDERGGQRIAHNTGTGVLPAYRGRRIVQRIYDYALPDLRRNGVERTTLEVLTTNERAIRAYRRVGFRITREYRCYRGNLSKASTVPVELREHSMAEVQWEELPDQSFYSWDFQPATLLAGNNRFFWVLYAGERESYFVLHPERKYLAQFGVLQERAGAWERLFAGVRSQAELVKVINVDARLTEKLAVLERWGFERTVDQFEMERGV